MRADTLRLYKSVHTWTGIVAGMALFIAFYAGALTVFKEPIARWVSPPAPGVASVALQDAPALIAGTLGQRPAAAQDFSLYLQPAEHLPARLGWAERPPGGDADDHDHGDDRHYAATLREGRVSVEETHPSALPGFIDTLHRVVGLPVDTDANRRVMGVVATLYALALVSGVIVLLPTLVKDFFALRLGQNLKRMWLDAHNVVGIVSLPFHVVMALTAVVFAFHDDIYDLQDKLIHQGRLEAIWRSGGPARPAAPPAPRDPSTMLPPQQLLATVHELAPGFTPRVMQYVQVASPRATVRVWGLDARDIARSSRGGFVALDPYTGKVQSTDLLPGHQSTLGATLTSFFSLHFANYGGRPVQWMYFLLGLGGAFLFYSGNLLWIETRRKAERRGQPAPVQSRHTAWMAAASVGVCLGCVCGISLSLVAGKWLHPLVADPAGLAAWHKGVYYAAFFAAMAWAFIRGAARSSVHLLWLAAAATAAIPATSLIALLAPSLGMWTHTSAATLGVDAVALAAAGAWAWMACATQRRVKAGRADSVWSAAPQPAAAGVESASA